MNVSWMLKSVLLCDFLECGSVVALHDMWIMYHFICLFSLSPVRSVGHVANMDICKIMVNPLHSCIIESTLNQLRKCQIMPLYSSSKGISPDFSK